MPDAPKKIGRPFEAGRSGNPGGRPKGLERTAREALAVREYTAKDGVHYVGIEAALHCLLDIGYDEKAPPRVRVDAFDKVFDRGYGKAKQKVELDGHVQVGTQDLTKMTREQLEDWIAMADRVADDEKDDDGPADEAGG